MKNDNPPDTDSLYFLNAKTPRCKDSQRRKTILCESLHLGVFAFKKRPRLSLASCCFLLFLFTGCSQQHLAVHTDFVGYEHLASYHVGTPDPKLACPDYGQRLHIAWNVPCEADLVVKTRIRFKNLQETEWLFSLPAARGRAAWVVLNGDYEISGGILTYKVELYNNTVLVEEQRHALWTELIEFL